MSDWLQRFKKTSKNEDSFGAEVNASLPKPKWYDVRSWEIGEWGSLASIIGIGLWASDKYGFKKGLETQAEILARKIKPVRKRKKA